MEEEQIQESEITEDKQDDKKYSVLQIVNANTIVDCCIHLLCRVDVDLLDYLVNQTPDNLKNDPSYLTIVATKEYIEKLDFINKELNQE